MEKDVKKVITERSRSMPELRFSEFEGVWSSVRLGDISKFISKGTTPNKFCEEGISFVKIESLNGINIIKEKCLFINESIHFGELKRSVLQENDILFAIAGATVGKIGLVSKDILPANTNQALAIIRLLDKSLVRIMLYILASITMKRYIRLSISVGAQPNLNLQQINDFTFFSSSNAEQQKIATFLSSVDDKINQLTKKKELLEKYKKGMMQKIFSQKIRFKPALSGVEGVVDGNDFPEWEEKKLGEVAKVNPRSINLPNRFCYIDLESVIKGRLLKENIIDLYDAPSRAQRVLQKGDILYQMVRPYQGNNYFFNRSGDFVASTGYAQLRADCSSKYLFYYLHVTSFVNRVIARCTGTSYPAINSSDLAKIRITLPSLPEQQKIASFLSAIDKKIEQTNIQLEKTKVFKKGLLQKMFV